MLKLNAGFSRKVGESNFGSRGASVNVELELESHLISDPDGLRKRIDGLFDLARRSVDDELNRPTPSNHQSQSNDQSNSSNGNRPVRYATQSQIRAIHAICQRIQRDPAQEASQRFRVSDVAELTIQEASSLIDELKRHTNNRNGGSR